MYMYIYIYIWEPGWDLAFPEGVVLAISRRHQIGFVNLAALLSLFRGKCFFWLRRPANSPKACAYLSRPSGCRFPLCKGSL